MILARFELKFDFILPLQITGNICVITIVKALLLENLLDPKYVFLDVSRHLFEVTDVLVKWNHVHTLNKVDKVARGHSGYELSVLYQY